MFLVDAGQSVQNLMGPTLIWHSLLVDWLHASVIFPVIVQCELCVCIETELWHKQRVFLGEYPGRMGTNLVFLDSNE